MKSERVSPRKKLKAVPTAANLSHVPKLSALSASAPREHIETSGDSPARLSPEERHLAIELAAYMRAERRGSSGGSPEKDWLEAEIEIDQMLKEDSQPSN